MIIIGAKGHAKEILEICLELGLGNDLFFFDNVNPEIPKKLFNTYPILKSFEDVKCRFKSDTSFASAIGHPRLREKIVNQFLEAGGTYRSIISKTAQIGGYDVEIAEGCNVMSNAFISNSVKVGKGCLINRSASIHHDVTIGDFCDVSPNATVLGRVKVGNFVSIGAGAIVLPDVIIENNVTIGAGAVVTKNAKEGSLIVGIPGKEK
jgi:sugar O-acyltransferase (sialic acid O-acetyltransferase NeuD family)